MQHAQNVGPILFMRNENIAHVMPRVIASAVTSLRASHSSRMPAHQPPKLYVVHQDLLMDMPFAQAELYLSKITASHFSTLNTKITNQNMLKRILIAMLNENMAKSNENFSIGAEETIAPLYK